MTKILGIESSCDDSAAAIIDEDSNILSNIVVSQLKEHEPYGGVVPEIAARSHMKNLEYVIRKALADANLTFDDIDAVAATTGPGLIGGVIVGTMFAKSIAAAKKLPFISINHLEGHALTARLTNQVPYPYLLLLASGGHCQFIAVESLGKYHLLGETLDDAAGEVFDKVAKMLKMGYPGGPIIEKMAVGGDNKKFILPLSMTDRVGCDMSFSGLKTAVLRVLEKEEAITIEVKKDLCASFQHTIARIFAARSRNAIQMFKEKFSSHTFVLAGGVAANKYIRNILEEELEKSGFILTCPPIQLCTDNAAMIAYAGLERYKAGIFNDLMTCPKARWSLN
jgi:N6-L-threonylcarbamoyladenine synthase